MDSQEAPVTVEQVEIFFAVEGTREPLSVSVSRQATVAEFALIAAQKSGVEGVVEVFRENAEDPLDHSAILFERLDIEFALLHVSRPGKIATTVEYNGRSVERHFRPSATIERVIEWAIGSHGFKLDGKSSDFQIKLNGIVLSPDTHLGQIAHREKAVKLDLVFKVKPQG